MAAEREGPSSATLNRLNEAASPYLRSARHQPVEWRSWGEDAFRQAQLQNKPVLLDIGAVWCHWCHVMDRESYENPEIARLINENFVAIKVDRDERPDVDSRYQAAVSALSGQGGWPLTAFLTPEGKPFFGGTYFPPDDHYGRPGLKRVLAAIAEAYKNQHGEVTQQAEQVMAAIARAEGFRRRTEGFSPAILEKIVESAAKLFDAEHGGFGSSPKFPHPAVMDLIIHQYSKTDDASLRRIFTTTLEKTARGGVYDQLGGGFHRYSVDERWIVPHFEKMSYDNAGLLANYVHAYQASGDGFFADVARDIIRWMDEWLSDRERGGFYGSQDADINLDDDGDYFTWTVAEAAACLSEEEFKVAALHYDIGEIGEMHHDPAKNVLYQRAPVDEISRRLGKSESEVRTSLLSAKQKMYAARLRRPVPYIDKTIYVNWNALCISAYLTAARVLELDDSRRFALRSLDRLLGEGWDINRGLAHVISYSEASPSSARIPGLLDDYAYAVLACLDGYESTADLRYFKFGQEIANSMIARFYDETAGGFFDSELHDGALGALSARRKPFQDSPTPAANPAAAIALLRLHGLTNTAEYRDKAEATLEVFAGMAEQYGMFAGTYGIAAARFSQAHTQVVILEQNVNDAAAKDLERAALSKFALNKSVVSLPLSAVAARNLPAALAETIPNLPAVHEGKTCAVVCSNFVCQQPISDPEQLRAALL